MDRQSEIAITMAALILLGSYFYYDFKKGSFEDIDPKPTLVLFGYFDNIYDSLPRDFAEGIIVRAIYLSALKAALDRKQPLPKVVVRKKGGEEPYNPSDEPDIKVPARSQQSEEQLMILVLLMKLSGQ